MPDWRQQVRDNLRLAGVRPEREAEIVEDLAQQLEDCYQDALTSGLAPADAARLAQEQIADWPRLSREVQQSLRGTADAHASAQPALGLPPPDRGRSMVAGLSHDVLFGLRMLRKKPAFTLAALLTLALGIGANTTMFGVIEATFLKKLAFPDPDRLVLLWKTDGTGTRSENLNIVSAPQFWDWQRLTNSYERMALFDSAGKGYGLGAAGAGPVEQVSGLRVTSGYFAVLGVKPMLGREFLPEEEAPGKHHEVILSYALWQRKFGGDRGVLGTALSLDGEPYTVVGIMPQDFQFQFWSDQRQLWVPAGWTEGDRSRDSGSFVAIARLKSGVTLAQAQAELNALQVQFARQYPAERKAGAAVIRASTYGVEEVATITLSMFAAVAFVLLIGCVNVANLLLAQGGERRKELAIRRALGASAARMLRQLLVESALLAALGAAAGLALAYWASAALTKILPRGLSVLPLRRFETVHIDARVLAFTIALAGLTALLFGIVPALGAVRADVNEPLKEGGRGSSRGGSHLLRHTLVATETALALIVLTAAGLMMKSLGRLVTVDPGFDPKNVLVVTLPTPQANTYYGPPSHPRFCQAIDEQIGSLSGVVSASAAAHLPMRGGAGRAFHIEGRGVPAPSEAPSGAYTVACPGYFRTMGVPVLEGREFTHRDALDSEAVVLINDAMKRKYWPNEDPVGKRIAIDWQNPRGWLTIVGVVGSTRIWGLDSQAPPQLFRPYTQAAWPWMQVVARTASDPHGYERAIKEAMARVEPASPVSAMRTMEGTITGSLESRRFPTQVLSAFSVLALVLAAIGIIGVVSQSVTHRTHEIGIRMALGAQRSDVLVAIMTRSMTWVLLGVAVGIGGSLAVTRSLTVMLYQVRPGDPLVLATTAVVLIVVALLASYAPARRAARLDPLAIVREA